MGLGDPEKGQTLGHLKQVLQESEEKTHGGNTAKTSNATNLRD